MEKNVKNNMEGGSIARQKRRTCLKKTCVQKDALELSKNDVSFSDMSSLDELLKCYLQGFFEKLYSNKNYLNSI